jgi:CheY-like chemotaxis protein
MSYSDDPPDEITVLHVDGYRAFAELSAGMLRRASGRLTVETARTAGEAVAAVRTVDPDCVVSAYDLPRTDGLALLERLRASRPGLPFVLFTGSREPGLRLEALGRGATAVLRKETDPRQFETLADHIFTVVPTERGPTPNLQEDDAPTLGDRSV